MYMSSPFRVSHRRSRSHTSLPSPSTTPLARSDKHRTHAPRLPSLITSQLSGTAAASSDLPFSPASAFTTQPPEKWDVEAWRRGKRPRRDPECPSEYADMDSCDEPMPSSPFAESQQSLSSPLSMSAPSTPPPRFASTSDAFQFFPSKASSSPAKQQSASMAFHGSFSDSSDQHRHADGFTQMHSEAFNDLRKTVSEAGEGFVRRMREFEAHRDSGPSRASALLSHTANTGCKPAFHKRGRKRPSPLSARQLNSQRENVGGNHGKESDSEEGESDIVIQSSCVPGSDEFRGWSPSKKRAVSLSALNYQEAVPVNHPHSLPFPISLRHREHSSSSSVSTSSESSSDEGEEITASSASMADRSRRRRALRFRSKALSSAKYSPPSLSFSASNSSSHLSLAASAPSPISLSGASNVFSLSSEHQCLPESAGCGSSIAAGPPAPQTLKHTEKAVEALSLALANGAGSVSDYEALRNAQGILSMEDGEAGSLWD